MMKRETLNPDSAVGRDGRIAELDGWRAVSVSLVILAHLSRQHPSVGLHVPIIPFGSFGGLGVKIFFVISGFVIFRLLIAEEASDGSISLKAFYLRRVCRILPPFYFYLAVLSVLLCFGLIHEHWDEILRAALFVTDFQAWPAGWFEGHSWSLSVEEQFYIIFPTIWVLTAKQLRPWVFLGFFLICTLWNLSAGYLGWNTITPSTVRGGFVCISFGVLMAIHEVRVRSFAQRISGFIVAPVALVLFLHPIGGQSWQELAYESLILPPAIGLLLFFSMERGRWLRAFLRSKPVQAIGITSYGIYLWQQLFTARRFDFSGAHEFMSLMEPLLFVFFPLSYFLIEKPAMRLGKSLSQRAKRSTISTAPMVEEPVLPS